MVADRTTVEHRDASCAVVTGRRIRSSSLRARTYALDELARHHDYLGWLVTPSSRLTVTDCSWEDGGIVGTRGRLFLFLALGLTWFFGGVAFALHGTTTNEPGQQPARVVGVLLVHASSLAVTVPVSRNAERPE